MSRILRRFVCRVAVVLVILLGITGCNTSRTVQNEGNLDMLAEREFLPSQDVRTYIISRLQRSARSGSLNLTTINKFIKQLPRTKQDRFYKNGKLDTSNVRLADKPIFIKSLISSGFTDLEELPSTTELYIRFALQAQGLQEGTLEWETQYSNLIKQTQVNPQAANNDFYALAVYNGSDFLGWLETSVQVQGRTRPVYARLPANANIAQALAESIESNDPTVILSIAKFNDAFLVESGRLFSITSGRLYVAVDNRNRPIDIEAYTETVIQNFREGPKQQNPQLSDADIDTLQEVNP
jgi:hypothetical protein